GGLRWAIHFWPGGAETAAGDGGRAAGLGSVASWPCGFRKTCLVSPPTLTVRTFHPGYPSSGLVSDAPAAASWADGEEPMSRSYCWVSGFQPRRRPFGPSSSMYGLPLGGPFDGAASV